MTRLENTTCLQLDQTFLVFQRCRSSSRTYTNNINEIYEYLGIEAARQAIVNELQATLDGARLEVDVRHLLLVADVMTSEGEVRAIGRHGVSGTKHSILARAAFR